MSENKPGDSTPKQAPIDQAQAIADYFNTIFGDLLERKTRDNIRSVYSNNAHFQSSELDFKILFGQINQTPAKTAVDWHTAVTMAWAQAKVLSYYLRINLAVYEGTNGTIEIPPRMLPSTFTQPPDYDTNATSKKLFETVQGIRNELMEEQMQFWPSSHKEK